MRSRGSAAAVVVSAACFGTLAVLLPFAYRLGGRPLPLLAWRFALTALLMAVYLLLRAPRSLAVSASDVGRFALLALSGYGLGSICFFFALQHASAPVVAVLLYTYPSLVALGGSLLGTETLTRERVAALVMTFAGCALVVGLLSGSATVSLPGVLLGLGSAVGYAAFNLLSHRFMQGRSRAVMMTYMFAISAVAMALIAVTTGDTLSPAAWPRELWALLGLIVLVPTFAAVVLYLEGIRGLGAPRAAILSTFEPLFTIVLAWLLLDQRLTALQAAGSLLVLGGVVVAERGAGAGEPVSEPVP